MIMVHSVATNISFCSVNIDKYSHSLVSNIVSAFQNELSSHNIFRSFVATLLVVPVDTFCKGLTLGAVLMMTNHL